MLWVDLSSLFFSRFLSQVALNEFHDLSLRMAVKRTATIFIYNYRSIDLKFYNYYFTIFSYAQHKNICFSIFVKFLCQNELLIKMSCQIFDIKWFSTLRYLCCAPCTCYCTFWTNEHVFCCIIVLKANFKVMLQSTIKNTLR